jgi:hypothetical protein
MNQREWKLQSRSKIKGIFEFRNKAVKIFNLQKGEIIHHLRETEEQRVFNDTYYERWGIDFNGDMKFAIKMTKEEHTHYHAVSLETRKKMSISRTGQKHTKETKLKQSITKLGDKNPNKDGHVRKGAVLSEESKQKMREKALGRKLSEEQKRNIRLALQKRDLSSFQGMKGKTHSEEARDKIRQSLKGKVWWNNGTIQTKQIDCPPGFVKGRLYHKRRTKEELNIPSTFLI